MADIGELAQDRQDALASKRTDESPVDTAVVEEQIGIHTVTRRELFDGKPRLDNGIVHAHQLLSIIIFRRVEIEYDSDSRIGDSLIQTCQIRCAARRKLPVNRLDRIAPNVIAHGAIVHSLIQHCGNRFFRLSLGFHRQFKPIDLHEVRHDAHVFQLVALLLEVEQPKRIEDVDFRDADFVRAEMVEPQPEIERLARVRRQGCGPHR